MDNFIRNQNIKLYRRLLTETTEEEQRNVLLVLLKLLLDKQDELSAHHLENIPTCPIDPQNLDATA